MGQSVTLTNSANQKFIFFDSTVTNLTISKSNNLFTASFPEEGENNNITINLGVKGQRTFDFKLVNTGQDVSGGTPGGIITVIQQANYLNDVFITTGAVDGYSFELETNHGVFTLSSIQFSSFTLNINAADTSIIRGNMSLEIGGGNQ